MFKIQIPKPCHEDWSQMTPTQQGAFCSACCKQVNDFTEMTDEEVEYYFFNHAPATTCGRFSAKQLQQISIVLPETILVQRMGNWKKWMAIVLLAFGNMLFGCNVALQEKSPGKAHTEQIVQPLLNDSIVISKDTLSVMGEVAPITLGTPAIVASDSANCQTTADKRRNSKAPILMGRPLLQPSTKKPVPNTH